MKPRMATLAVFTLANNFGDSIRGGWRNIVACLLKLRKLQLLLQSANEFETTDEETLNNAGSEPDLNILPSQETKFNRRQGSSLMGRFSHFLALDSVEESVALGMSEFEQNLKVIKQCRIGQIFSKSSVLPDVAVLNLGRSLIYAAVEKGQKFSTAIEEEETVKFGWDLIIAVALSNIHRFSMFWPSYHEYLLNVANFPLFSPFPVVEKGIPGLFKVCIKILASQLQDQLPEELTHTLTTLARREEIRNRAVTFLEKSFIMAHKDLGFTPSGCIYCIDHVVFPTIDDLHEKLLDYSRRENAER